MNQTIVDQLRRNSAERCKASDKFQKLERNIVRYKEQKAKKSVTLNEAKYLKELAEMNADKEEEKAMEKLGGVAGSATIKKDYYLDEVLNITADYIGAMKQVAKDD